MFRLKLKGDAKNALNVISSISKPVEVEVFILVNDQKLLLDIIQKCILSGIAIEIVPERVSGNEGAVKLSEPGIQPTTVATSSPSPSTPTLLQTTASTASASISVEDAGTGSEILRKYKMKKKARREPKEEKEEAEIRHEKAEEKEGKEEEKAEAKSGKATEETREKTQETLSFEERIAKQVQEAEKELSFDEWLRLRDESFSRKLIE